MLRRLLVTGGTGYLGREVVGQARQAGWEVIAAARSGPDVAVDIADPVAVRRVLAELRPHAVVHAAYAKDRPDAWAVTVNGAAYVAAEAARHEARLVHLSTDVVFDGRAGRPYDENDEPNPITEYGRAKLTAERRVQSMHPEAVMVRTSLIYGGPGVAPGPHEVAAHDPNGVFYTDEIRCPVQVGDLAAALLELVDVDYAGPLHVAGADAVSRWEFAQLVTGSEKRGAPAPADRPLDCRLETGRAAKILHTRLRGIREVCG